MKLLLLCVLFGGVSCRPYCYGNQQWVNGGCRDVWWYDQVTASPANVVTVPVNCPPGQEYVNGQCRDVWFRNLFQILNTQPSNPRKDSPDDDMFGRSIITVPNQCPIGYRPDALGNCRRIADM